MKSKKFIVRGTPIVPSLCAILMTLLWYFSFFYIAPAEFGGWQSDFAAPQFSSLSATETTLAILRLAIPVALFVGVLFLAELDLRWMTIPLLLPVAYQTICFVYAFIHGEDYVFEFPFSFCVPFVLTAVFLLTVTGAIPNKIPLLVVCGLAVLAPLALTLFRIGEFAEYYPDFDAALYRWSEYLNYALYPLAVGALAVRMRPPKEGEMTTKQMAEAYAKLMEEQQAAAEDQPAEEE